MLFTRVIHGCRKRGGREGLGENYRGENIGRKQRLYHVTVKVIQLLIMCWGLCGIKCVTFCRANFSRGHQPIGQNVRPAQYFTLSDAPEVTHVKKIKQRNRDIVHGLPAGQFTIKINLTFYYSFIFTDLIESYCRSPDDSSNPWCYYRDVNGRLQKGNCPVPVCKYGYWISLLSTLD